MWPDFEVFEERAGARAVDSPAETTLCRYLRATPRLEELALWPAAGDGAVSIWRGGGHAGTGRPEGSMGTAATNFDLKSSKIFQLKGHSFASAKPLREKGPILPPLKKPGPEAAFRRGTQPRKVS
jgi:hypothetical protein